MAYNPLTIGQQPMSSSQGVVIASDQSPVSVTGTVGASIIGAVPVTFTPPANQSVSGTVQADIRASVAVVVIGGSIATSAPANQSVSGAVTANQGTNAGLGSSWPVKISNGTQTANVTATSMLSVTVDNSPTISGSVATVIIGGSIAATFTPPANQSVSGAVSVSNFPTTQNVSGSVVAFQGGVPWADTIVGSVITLSQGSIAAVIIGGSIATATTNSSVFLLNSPNTIGSVIAYQGITPWVVVASVYQGVGWSGSVAAIQSGTRITSVISSNPSSMLVGASLIGISPVTLTANTVPPASSILLGVTANTNGSVLNTVGYPQAIIQITSGPGASITGAINFEGTVDGTQFVPIQGYNIANNVISSMATVDSDWSFNTAGLQGIRARVSNWSVGSITARAVVSPSDARPFATFNAGGFSSVSGTIGASIIGQLPAGVAMIGSIAAYQGAVPWAIAGSVAAFQAGAWSASIQTLTITSIATAGQVMGSVATLQGTNPWTTNFQNSSILAVPVGSVITVLQGASIVGTYAEDAAHTSGDKGMFSLQVRNDTMSSITSADSDYSPQAVGPVGEVVMANSPITKWVSGTASMLTGTPLNGGSVLVIAAQGASIFTYISGIQIANPSANNVYVRFDGATSSTIAFTMAPANGGSNIVFPNPIKTNANGAFTASVSGSASVFVSAQGFISKT